MARYTRKGAAARLKELGYPVSPNTLWRWENSDPPKYEPPKRIVHNRQCVYTDETIQSIMQFMQKEEPPDNLVAR